MPPSRIISNNSRRRRGQHFFQIHQEAFICIICESRAAAFAIRKHLHGNKVAIYILQGVPKMPPLPHGTGITSAWETFAKYRFKEYFILTDKDASGCTAAGLSFLAVRTFHPNARIFGKCLPIAVLKQF